MKKIAITVSEGSIARNILRSGVLEELLKNENLEVVLLTFADKINLYRQEFGGPRVRVISIPTEALPVFFDRVLNFLCRNCFFTETLVSLQKQRYIEGGGLIAFLIKQALIRTLGRSAVVHGLIRTLASLRRPVSYMKKALADTSPDLLFATDVQDDFDLHAIASARKLGIKYVGMVRSWDNPTQMLVQVVAPALVVWNKYVAWRMATVQHVPPDTTKIIGMPQYDEFFRREGILPRETFLSALGIDPAARIILFAATGTYFMPYEWEIPLIIQRAIEEGKLPRDCIVFARPHPNFPPPQEITLAGSKIFLDKPVSYYAQGAATRWELGRKDINHFANLMTHADVVVVGASSIAIDAALFDRPVVNIAYDGHHDVAYHKSARRLYKDYSHYVSLIETGGTRIAWNTEEMVSSIKQYLDNPYLDGDGRKRLREEFITFQDGRSSERLAASLFERLGY